MKFLLLFAFTLFSCSTFAQTRPDWLERQVYLNKASPNHMQKAQLGDVSVRKTKHVLVATYSFAVQGGAQTTIDLLDVDTGKAAKLPKGALVHDCILDFRTPGAGATATLSFGTGQATNDLKNALAVASATGIVACIPVGTAATTIKLTADRTPTLTIGTANLTAGVVNVVIEYYLSDT